MYGSKHEARAHPPRAGGRPRGRGLRARHRARWGCASAPRARAPPTSSPPSPTPTWTRCRWWPSPPTSRRPLIGTDAFQEADITGITMPITKHNWLVTDAEGHRPRILKEAFYLARTGRPGPVLVDIPKDVLQRPGRVRVPGVGAHPRLPSPVIKEEPRLGRGGLAHPRPPRAPASTWAAACAPPTPSPRCSSSASWWGRRWSPPCTARGPSPRPTASACGMFGMHGAALRQLHDPELRPDHRAGRPLRRPRHRQALHLRPRGQDHPPGRRPGRDLEAGHRHRAAGRGSEDCSCRSLTDEPCRPPSPSTGRPTSPPGGSRWTTGGRSTRCASTRRARSYILPQTAVAAHLGEDAGQGRSSPPAWASTRCAPPSSGRSSGRASSSPRAAWAPWASACRPPSASSSARPDALVIGIDGDGSFQMTLQDLATAVRPQAAHQDLHPQQPVPGHGAPVAGALLRGALRRDAAHRPAPTS